MADLNAQATQTPETPTAEATQVTPATSTEEQDITTLVDEATADASPKKDGEPAKEEAVPEKYDVKLPDGAELDTAMLDIFTPIFKELKLSTEGVQKLVDAYVPIVNNTADNTRKALQAEFQKTTEEWKTETMKELGDNAKTSLSYVGKAIQKFGDQELRELMQHTGVGNHKALVRFLSKVGKTISEDAFVDGGSSTKVDPLSVMYPSMKQ